MINQIIAMHLFGSGMGRRPNQNQGDIMRLARVAAKMFGFLLIGLNQGVCVAGDTETVLPPQS